jgi:hypothetical protein
MGTLLLLLGTAAASGAAGWGLGVRWTRASHARHAERARAWSEERPREGIRLRSIRITR